MKVKFLKEYNGRKKDTQLEISRLSGMYLVEQGICEVVKDEILPISDIKEVKEVIKKSKTSKSK